MSLGVLVLLVVAGTTIWVGFDASKRDWRGGSGTATWVVGCLLLWIVVFPLYLVKRGRASLRDSTPGGDPFAGPSDPLYREYPHCKEPMRRDAGTCPHCRLQSPPWRFHEGRWWSRASEEDDWQWFDEANGTWVHVESARTP